jgi:ligand-binding sensor domain-containing protein
MEKRLQKKSMSWRRCLCFRSVFVIVFILALFNTLSAQTYSFKHFGIEKNVFPSRIEALAQAEYGELLVGTLAGLVVYDGVNFTQITVNEGLTENAISAITVHEEEIWLGHWAGNISVYDLSTGKVKRLILQEQLNFSTIKGILYLDSSEVLINTESGGLFRLKNGTLEQEVISEGGKNPKILGVDRVGDQLFAYGVGGVYTSNLEQDKGIWIHALKLPNLRVNDFLYVDDEHQYLATNNGLYISKSDSINQLAESLGLNIIALTSGENASVWCGTEENGVLRFSLKSGEIEKIKRRNGLSYNQVRDVFVDREGIFWVATSAGLDQYLGDAFTFFDFGKTSANSLIWDFAVQNNQLFTATGDGVTVTDISHFKTGFGVSTKLDFNNVDPRRVTLNPKTNEVFLTSENGRLFSKSLKNGNTVELTEVDAFVRCVAVVNNQQWVGTDNGIYVLEAGEVVAKYSVDNGLGGQKVNGVYHYAAANETWITFLGGYVTVFRNGRFKQFNNELGLTSKVIQDAAFDSDGNIWLASYDQGLFKVENDTFQNLSTKNGLSSNTTFAIDIDAEGSVWIGHNWGLDRYRPKYKDTQHFGVDEGFIGIEVNPSALTIAEDGSVWMGTLMGMLRFDPKKYQANMIEPKMQWMSATLGEHNLLNTSEEVHVSDNNFRVVYKGVSLMNPSKNRFKYRLSGVHNNWKEIADIQPIEYQTLPPGFYTFEMVGCNNDGQCSTSPLSISFVIVPPFYRAWWFYSILFGIAVLFIFFMDRYKSVKLIEEKNQLSEKLEHKRQIITELEQKLSELRDGVRSDEKIISDLFIDQRQHTSRAALLFDELSCHNYNPSVFKSDHWFDIEHVAFDLAGIVNTGLTGPSSLMLINGIKSNFYKRLALHPKDEALKPEWLMNEFEKAAQEGIAGLSKHKGLEWLLCLKLNGQRYYHQYGISIYLYDNDQVLELKAIPRVPGQGIDAMQLLQADYGKLMFAATNGLFELMDKTVSKHYSSQILKKELGDLKNGSTEEQLRDVVKSIDSWKSEMDNKKDVTLILWKHAE